jgi:hypothetical protein
MAEMLSQVCIAWLLAFIRIMMADAAKVMTMAINEQDCCPKIVCSENFWVQRSG